MFIRRVLYNWMLPAAAVLPVWLLVGWGVFGGSGWAFLFLVVACLALAGFLAAVAAIMRARRSVRQARAVSWWDAAVLIAWHGSLVGLGFFGPATPLFVLLGVVFALVAFWYSLGALFSETRRRVRAALDGYLEQVQRAAPRLPNDARGGEVIVVREHD
jgi:hypothetical protein